MFLDAIYLILRLFVDMTFLYVGYKTFYLPAWKRYNPLKFPRPSLIIATVWMIIMGALLVFHPVSFLMRP